MQVKIPNWYKKLDNFSKFCFWSGLCSIVAIPLSFILWWHPSPISLGEKDTLGQNKGVANKNALQIKDIKVSSRGPLWDNESLNRDEIVINVSATINDSDMFNDHSLVAFWRLANGYETNWHVGRRRDGGNFRLAMYDPRVSTGESDFLFGGIDCDDDYNGDIKVVLLVYPNSTIQSQSNLWIKDKNGWGFQSLPKGYVMASAMKTFR